MYNKFYWLRFQLESDATFGRGDGIPGLVDREIVLDEYGCPYLQGRTLKGLLNESCADILYALGMQKNKETWKNAADQLFGIPGSKDNLQGKLYVGHAQLPADLHAAIRSTKKWSKEDVTNSLTAIRRQTALALDGAPDPSALRSTRVILRDTLFEARLTIREPLDEREKRLLAACTKGLRRAGTARNRGRGRLHAWLDDSESQRVSDSWFAGFKEEITQNDSC